MDCSTEIAVKIVRDEYSTGDGLSTILENDRISSLLKTCI